MYDSLSAIFLNPDKCSSRRRRGSVILASCAMIPVFLLLLGLSIEAGHLTLAKGQLRTAADAAALAAANELEADAPLHENEATAFLTAKATAMSNEVLGQAQDLVPQDVEVGHWNPVRRMFTPGSDSDKVVNAVRVTAHRCGERDQNVSMLWFNTIACDLHAEAVAHRLAADPPVGFIGLDRFRSRGVLTTAAVGPTGRVPMLGRGRRGGDIHSNGDVDLHVAGLAGVTHINGDINAGGDVNRPAVRLLTRVTGRVATPHEPYALPVVPETMADRNDNDRLPSHAYDGRNLTAVGIMNLNAGVYKVEDFRVLAGAIVNVRGPTTIVVTGDASIVGSVISLNQRASDLRVLVANDGRVDLAATADLYCDLYAPESKVSVTGGLRYTGRIVGKEIDILATSFLFADPSIGDPFAAAAPLTLVK